MNKRPYVHLYCDVLDKMPMLSHGSNAAIYFTLGVLGEADISDIAKYTGLNRKTIETTLETLQTFGLVTASNHGKYTAENHIENRSREKKIFSTDNLSINRQSIHPIHPSKVISTAENDSFGKSLRALTAVLMSYGGMNAIEMQSFSELWEDYPDAELHARALQIMVERADRPNYRYYAAVVRSGAQPTTYPTKRERVTREKQAAVLEIKL